MTDVAVIRSSDIASFSCDMDGAARASFPYACRGSRPAERPGRREWRGDQVQGGEEGSTAGLVSPGLRKIRRGSGGRVSSAVSPPRLRRGKPGAFVGPERGPGRRTHYAAQMSAAGPRTVPIYSQSVLVDVPTRKILSGHGLDDPCPAEFKLRFHVYKKVAVTAALITSEGEEAYACLALGTRIALFAIFPRAGNFGDTASALRACQASSKEY